MKNILSEATDREHRERRANRAVASRRAKEAESAVEAPYRHEMANA